MCHQPAAVLRLVRSSSVHRLLVAECGDGLETSTSAQILNAAATATAAKYTILNMADDFIRPDRSLKGKVAIVTGAGSLGDGIGNARAAAILMAEDGCSVVCVDRDLKLAQRTVEMIEQEGLGQAVAVQADVTSLQDCENVVKTAVDTYGRLDILFNCVGVGGAAGTAVEVDMLDWAKGLEVNVSSMVQMVKFAIPEMVKNDAARGYRGSIINMGSVAGIRGGTPHLLYPTSKGAVVNMTRAMAHHHAADGIRVNCVCPGMFNTLPPKGQADVR